MAKYDNLHVEIDSNKSDDLKIIAIRSRQTKKQLIDEALDFLREKYKKHLRNV